MKKIIVVVDKKEEELTGENLFVITSSNANQPTGLLIRDGDKKIAEFSKWTYWKKVE